MTRGFDEDTNARNVFTKVVETGQKIDVPTYRFDVYNHDNVKIMRYAIGRAAIHRYPMPVIKLLIY